MSAIGGVSLESLGVFGGAEGTGGAQQIDDTIEQHLLDGGKFNFDYRGNDYYLAYNESTDSFECWIDKNPPELIDADVEINSEGTVDGFIEIQGLYNSHGEALYIGNNPSEDNGEILFIEGDAELDRANLESNPQLSRLLSDEDQYVVHDGSSEVSGTEGGGSTVFLSDLPEGVYVVEDGEILDQSGDRVGVAPANFGSGTYSVSEEGELDRMDAKGFWQPADDTTGEFDLAEFDEGEYYVENGEIYSGDALIGPAPNGFSEGDYRVAHDGEFERLDELDQWQPANPDTGDFDLIDFDVGEYSVEDGELYAGDDLIGPAPEGFEEGEYRVNSDGEFEKLDENDVWQLADPETGKIIGGGSTAQDAEPGDGLIDLGEGVYTVEDGEIQNQNGDFVADAPSDLPEGSYRVSSEGQLDRMDDAGQWRPADPATGEFDLAFFEPGEYAVENGEIFMGDTFIGLSPDGFAEGEYRITENGEFERLDENEEWQPADPITGEPATGGTIDFEERAAFALGQYDGFVGGDGTRPDGAVEDGQLSDEELREAGVASAEDRQLLLMATGDNYLSEQELIELQRDGIIEIDFDGKITVTEEGREALRAEVA